MAFQTKAKPKWFKATQRVVAVIVAVMTLTNFGAVSAFLTPQVVHATAPTPPTTVTNPPLGQACGLDIGLVIDSSGSINNTELTQMKNAFKGFVDAFLPGTPTEFSVNEFDTNLVGTTLPFTDNVTNIKNRINAASSGGYTNWEAALYDMHNQYDPRASKPDLIVFASDGNPNTVGINGNSTGGAASEATAVSAAVTRANAIKNDGIRIIALGIGNDLDVDNLVAISGPNVAPPGTIDETADVIKADFSTLATTLAELAGELCGGKILVQKQIDVDGDGQVDIDGTNPNALLSSWTFDVNGTPSNPVPQSTTNTGSLEFEVENGTYSVKETVKSGYVITDAFCTNDAQQVGTFNSQTNAVEGLQMGTDETISCTFVNHPTSCDLKITKSVDKTQATPGETLTYTIEYENEGDAFCTGGGVKLYDHLKSDAGKPGLTYVPGSAKVVSVTNDQDLHSGDPAPEVFANSFVGDTAYPTENTNSRLGNLHEIGPGESGVIELKATVNQGDYCDEWDVWNSGWTNGNEPESDQIFQSEKTHITTPCEGTLKVKKFVDTGDLTPDNWSFTVGNDTKTPAQGTNFVIFTLPGGTYTATESTVPGYHQVSSTCTNVQVVPNQQATCEFHNAEDRGELTVIKKVVGGDNVSSDWNMIVNQGPNVIDSFPGNPNGTTRTVKAGDYKVTESPDYAGYSLTYSGDCDKDGNVTVADGDSKTCTLTNSRDKGSIEVHKAYDYNNDGIVDETDPVSWTWNLDGVESNITAGATRDLLTGVNYTVSENDDAEYNSSWLCTINGNQYKEGLGTQTENLAVEKDDHIVCTFNNVRKFGEVTFEKIVVGGDALSTDWTFHVDGKTYNHGQTVSFPTGSYPVTEKGPQGYTNTDISGICSPSAVAAGGTLVVTEKGGTCTFTNTRDTGRIIVYKNVDTDGDGQVDVTGATNWTWDITNGQQNIATGTGTGVVTGTYTISEDQKTNYHVSDLTCDGQSYGAVESGSVTVAKDKVVECTFTNTRDTGSLRIKKFEDFNGDGVKNGNDTYLTGWAFTVKQGNTVIGTYTTGQDPINSDWIVVSGLPTGDYTVTETQQTGWTNTTPLVQNATVFYNQMTTKYFGNFELGKIHGYKWNDVDGSGDFTTGDYVLSGWTICLDAQTCDITDEFGYFEFTNLSAGDYTVYETVLPGWMAIFPTTSHSVSIKSGGNKQVDFYNFKYGKISGHKFEDTNGNGVWDNGEPALENWDINLSGVANDSDTTDVDGYYAFDTLTVGDYDVTETNLPGWTQTTPNPATMSVESGSVFQNVDFGNFENVDITICKVEDADGNLDTNDTNPLYGWTFKLYKDGQLFDTQTSDEGGCYTWTDLGPGEYSATEGSEDGWIALGPTTYDFGVAQSGETYEHTFANFELGTIAGFKFEDVNNDGEWLSTLAGDENGLEGWEINLWSDNGGAPGVVLKTTTTNEFGYFEFTDLGPGSYWLSETLRDGWYQYAPLGGVFGPIVVTSGFNNNQQESYFEFGNAEKVTLELDKYNDQQVDQGGDGILETTETINYTIDWGVAGNSIATNVVLVDQIPSELAINIGSISDSGVWDADLRTITWDFGTQNPGASGFVTYSATVIVPIEDGTVIHNVARISADNSDPQYLEDDSDVTVKSDPVMGIEKTVDIGNDLGFVNPGDTVEYTVVVSSTGTTDLINVELTDTLPTGFLFADTLTPSKTWNLGDIVVGGSVTTTFEVFVGKDVEAGFYDNIAAATADNHDPVDDDATVEVRVPTPEGETTEPILTIEKTVNAEFTNPGETLEYTVVITNSGDGQALDVTLTDSLPEGFTFIENGTANMMWELGAIDVGASKSVVYKVFVGNEVEAGDYENLAIADASNHDPIQDRVSVEVRVPRVLAESVPNTGATPRDFVIFLASLLMIIAGALFIHQGRVRVARDNK